jgi:hypothetical protein
MATIEPTLYADGKLRLTDHGPRGGGIVLKHVGGQQVDIAYTEAASGPIVTLMLGREIEAMARCRYEPEVILDQVAKTFETKAH